MARRGGAYSQHIAGRDPLDTRPFARHSNPRRRLPSGPEVLELAGYSRGNRSHWLATPNRRLWRWDPAVEGIPARTVPDRGQK